MFFEAQTLFKEHVLLNLKVNSASNLAMIWHKYCIYSSILKDF